jgi:hypothetical protein
LRRLQNGDERAAELLVQRYSWWLRVRVGRAVRKVSGGLFFGDIFSCVLIRFLECLKTFRPRSNNGLRAYLDKAIDGAISDAQQEWQSKGFGGFDTRLRRFLRSGAMLDNLSPLQLQKLFPHHTAEQLAGRNEENRKLGLEEIQKLFPNYTLDEIAQAQEPIVMQPYSEGAVDDGNGYQDDADSGYAVAAASADPVNAQRSTSSQYSKRAALGYRWPKEHAQRNVFAYQVSPRKRVYGSPWVDLVERYSAARDEAFLKHLGRQKFTEWKMEHRCTANTGDWDENGNWRPTEHRRLIEDGPSSRVVAVLNEYRSDSVADLVTAATTSHLIQGNKYGLQMLLGGIFIALANGLDDEGRARALDMIAHFSERETFSPTERAVFHTICQMADDVFTPAAQPKSGRLHLRLVN